MFKGIEKLSREVTLSNLFYLPSEKEFHIKGNKLFPLRVRSFSEGIQCAGKKAGRHNSFFKNGRQSTIYI